MIAGRYTLIKEIGRGGSGSVHLARDEVLGRTVAIKRIGMMPGGSAADLTRAEREARLAAALNHPNVVSIFDLVEEDDVHWLVMEHVDGRTLSEHVLAHGPLGVRETAMVIGQAADALSDAHAVGIVHRDVKPSNILLTDQLDAKLSDFGIARAESDAALTQTGLVTGSPAYLAPEVASGAVASPASDVWALGATLFHAVTGSPPYDTTDNLMGALYKIVHEDPPRLPADHPFAGLLSVTMEKDPAKRWSMDKVRDELRRLSRGQAPVPPAERTAVLRTDKVEGPRSSPGPAPHARRFPTAWLAGAAALALIVALAVWMWPGDGVKPAAEDEPSASAGTTTTSPKSAPESANTQQDITDFITSYLATTTSDPRSAFEQLTPEFQEASGGYEGYVGWWGNVQSASPSKIVPNAANLTVGYTVDYVMKNGKRSTEQVILQLERQDDGYLIAGEA